MQYTLFRSSCNAKPCLPIAYKTPGTGSHKVANWKILTNVGSNQDSHLRNWPNDKPRFSQPTFRAGWLQFLSDLESSTWYAVSTLAQCSSNVFDVGTALSRRWAIKWECDRDLSSWLRHTGCRTRGEVAHPLLYTIPLSGFSQSPFWMSITTDHSRSQYQ